MDSKTTRYDQDENLSSLYDGERLPEGRIELSRTEKDHLENWSLIGAALRDELPKNLEKGFADRVAEAVAREPLPRVLDDQETVNKPIELKFSFTKLARKFGFVFAETAVAASIAMVTIVGWQTYNAENNLSLLEPATATLGAVEGLNLASYQNSGSEKVIKLDSSKSPSRDYDNLNNQGEPASEEVQELRRAEAERINNYIRGYVLNTAAN